MSVFVLACAAVVPTDDVVNVVVDAVVVIARKKM